MPPKSSQVAKTSDDSMVAVMFDEAAVRVPQYATYIKTAKPYFVAAGDAADKAWPYAVKLWDASWLLWEKLQPYGPEQFFPLIFGIVLCFFGGSYVTLIAAMEAIRLTVWDQLRDSVKVLYSNYCKARDVSAKDDQVDADGNGVADVREITKRNLLTRKVHLVLKTIDPEQTSQALGLAWGAVMAVVATLKVKFAQSVTLGSSLGSMLHKRVDETLTPALADVLPAELKKWAPVTCRIGCNLFGVMVAWFLNRVISGFHSAIRGGHLVVTNLILLGQKHGYAADIEPTSSKATALAFLVAGMGFYWQLSNAFGLPFPLNVLFLPLSILEWFIEFAVGV